MENELEELKPATRRRRSGRIRAAVDESGLSRSLLYEKAAEERYKGLFRKAGKTVIVDFDILHRVVDDLPYAVISPPKQRVSKARLQALAAEAAQSTTT
jgi:hypothetical protein